MEVENMTKLLSNYPNVRISRSILPQSKGMLNDYLTLAYRCNYRDGTVKYCGYENYVKAGQWSGGIVGLTRMLKKRTHLHTTLALKELENWDYISVELGDGGKMTITINGLFASVLSEVEIRFFREYLDILNDDNKSKIATNQTTKSQYSQIQNTSKKCYVNDNRGFIFLPRNLTKRLVDNKYKFDDGDAFLDVWLHTVYHESLQPFSENCPSILYKSKPVITLDFLAQRWAWHKSKVCRFFKKYSNYFTLIKLQSSYGCIVFNTAYFNNNFSAPTQNDCFEIINQFKTYGEHFFNEEEKNCSENDYVNLCIKTFSNFPPPN